MSEMNVLEKIKSQALLVAEELLSVAKLQENDLVVIGCSTSEVLGKHIGSAGSPEAARAIWEGLAPAFQKRGIFLAIQCCEHLNRALIIEKEAAKLYGLTRVNAVPHAHAGGSFATVAYNSMQAPCAVEQLSCAAAGIDIGDTLIGMHLRPVAIPVRISISQLGEAHLVLARTRPKYIGGTRAHYDENLG